MTTITSSKPTILSVLKSAVIAGGIAAVINVAYLFFCQYILKITVPVMINIGSVAISSIVPLLLGGVVYFGLTRFSPKAKMVFVVLCIILTVLSVGSGIQPTLPDGTPTPEGFLLLTFPMHIVAGAAAAYIIPKYS